MKTRSDKIIEMNDTFADDVCLKKDVKEYIRDILNEIEKNYKDNNGLSFYDTINIIKNTAGPKLI